MDKTTEELRPAPEAISDKEDPNRNGVLRKGRARKVRDVHYVLSTHWDREWYQTFQDYRRRLVRLFDRVLDDLESGRLKGPFTTDGQAIILEDYLEIRPERREQVVRFAKAGRLKIGPWYVLPDEWLVSGESLIRNLELGRRIAREFGGEPSNAGFVCDLFGHTGQLPQIFRGFGIGAGLLWRGVEPRKTAHLIWRGSDGTSLPFFRFGRSGYTDFSQDVRRAHQPRHQFEKASAVAGLKRHLAGEAARTVIPPVLLFDGGDHLEHDGDHYDTLFEDRNGGDFPYRVVHGTLDDYLAQMVEHAHRIREVVHGELREHAVHPSTRDQQWLIPGVLSSRAWIKQDNVACQTLLCHWAEPFAWAASVLTGVEYPDSYLKVAWRWLLANHPHDSICGCSIDAVHEDMKYRFAQCRQIATTQADESLVTLAASIAGEIGEKEFRVLVANPLPQPLEEPVDLALQIPAEWACFTEYFAFERKPAFRIYGSDGSELPYQVLSQELDRTKRRIHPLKYPELYKTHDVTVCVRLSIPALGYTTLVVREGERAPTDGVIAEQVLPTRHPQTPGLATSERSMENETLGVTIEPNGTLTVTDKRTRQVYQRLLTFEDCADIGDGWYHGLAVNDQKFVSTGARCEVALVYDGSHACQFRVRILLEVPREHDFAVGVRSAERVALVIDNFVTLRRSCDRVEVGTVVDNVARDHRLRVLFPTGVAAKTYLADNAFDVVERRIGLPPDYHLARELAVETAPQQSWTAVARANRGLAIVSVGQMESAVCDWPERPIALTLFRSTRRTVLTDGEPEGQLQGRMCFRYWIVPQGGPVDRAQLCRDGIQLAAGVRTAQVDSLNRPLRRTDQALPTVASLLKVGPGVVVTSARVNQSAFELRLFNPGEKPAVAVVEFPGHAHFAGRPKGIVSVDFEGNHLGAVRKFEPRMRFPVKPKEILTLRLLGEEDAQHHAQQANC